MYIDYLDFTRRHWPMLCFGLLTIFFGNFGQTFFISWFGTAIQQHLELSATHYGSIYSAATLISGLGLMAVGGLIDRINLRYFVYFAGVGLFIACLLMWQTTSVMSLGLAFIMLRFFGQGLLPHTSATTMARYFSANRGKALSIAATGLPLGEVLLPALAVALIAWVGWQKSWLVIALFIPLIFLPSVTWLLAQARKNIDGQPVNQNASAQSSLQGSRRTLLADLRFWLALPLVLMPPFVITGIFIHQGVVLQEKGWSFGLFAWCFVVYGSVHWLSSMMTGHYVDRYSGIKLLPLVGVPFVLGLLAAGYFDGAWVALVLMSCLGIGIGMTGTIVTALWAEVYGTQYLGSIRSLVTSLGILSTSVSPILLGILIDQAVSISALLLSLGGYALVATALSWFSYRQ